MIMIYISGLFFIIKMKYFYLILLISYSAQILAQPSMLTGAWKVSPSRCSTACDSVTDDAGNKLCTLYSGDNVASRLAATNEKVANYIYEDAQAEKGAVAIAKAISAESGQAEKGAVATTDRCKSCNECHRKAAQAAAAAQAAQGGYDKVYQADAAAQKGAEAAAAEIGAEIAQPIETQAIEAQKEAAAQQEAVAGYVTQLTEGTKGKDLIEGANIQQLNYLLLAVRLYYGDNSTDLLIAAENAINDAINATVFNKAAIAEYVTQLTDGKTFQELIPAFSLDNVQQFDNIEAAVIQYYLDTFHQSLGETVKKYVTALDNNETVFPYLDNQSGNDLQKAREYIQDRDAAYLGAEKAKSAAKSVDFWWGQKLEGGTQTVQDLIKGANVQQLEYIQIAVSQFFNNHLYKDEADDYAVAIKNAINAEKEADASDAAAAAAK